MNRLKFLKEKLTTANEAKIEAEKEIQEYESDIFKSTKKDLWNFIIKNGFGYKQLNYGLNFESSKLLILFYEDHRREIEYFLEDYNIEILIKFEEQCIAIDYKYYDLEIIKDIINNI